MNCKTKILIIYHKSRKYFEHLQIFDWLSNKANVKMIHNENYQQITQELLNSKMIITPCSHWTLIANLYKKPVFSWGTKVSLWHSTYNFDNENYTLTPLKKCKSLDNLFFASLNNFIKRNM